MGLKSFLKGKSGEIIAKLVDKDADGADAAKAVLDILSKKVGPISARRIARNNLTNYFRELIEGLWENDGELLFIDNIKWNGELRGRIRDVEETD